MIRIFNTLRNAGLCALVLFNSGCYSENASVGDEEGADAGEEFGTDEEISDQVETAAKPLFPAYEWMRHIPDARLLSEFSIPGTHDSLALYDATFPPGTAKAQAEGITAQLNHGIRFLDLRFSVVDYPKNPRLRAHHGPIDEKLEATAVFDEIAKFLKAHSSESVIVSLKEERGTIDQNTVYPYAFEKLMGDQVLRNLAVWATDEWVPRLGAVRGKMVLMRRFTKSGAWPIKELKGGQWLSKSEGINAADGWPSNGTGTAGVLNIEDKYEFHCGVLSCNQTLVDKWSAVTSHLGQAPPRSDNRWYLTFTSATRYPAAQSILPAINAIPAFANYVNPRVSEYLAGKRRNFGVITMDYASQNLAQAVISTND